MNRRLASWTLAAVAVFGLTACSSSPASAPTTPAAQASTAAPTPSPEETSTEQTVAEACVAMTATLNQAGDQIARIAEAANDPQSALDAWNTLTDAYQQSAETLENSTIKPLAEAATTDIRAVRDGIQKFYVDGDAAGATEFTSAVTKMSESLTALTQACLG